MRLGVDPVLHNSRCLRIDHFAVTLPFGFNPKYIHTVEERDRDAPTTKQPDHLAIVMRLSAKF